MDWNNPYMTLDPKYMESSWWMLKRTNEQDLLEDFSVTELRKFFKVKNPEAFVQ